MQSEKRSGFDEYAGTVLYVYTICMIVPVRTVRVQFCSHYPSGRRLCEEPPFLHVEGGSASSALKQVGTLVWSQPLVFGACQAFFGACVDWTDRNSTLVNVVRACIKYDTLILII